MISTRSNHLWRKRANDETPTTIENLWIDIGARSRADAQRMGIDVLDPVVRDWPEWLVGDYVAGPAAANRAGCAAVAGPAPRANNRPAIGETVFIISTQKSFNWAGLTSAVAATRPRRQRCISSTPSWAAIDRRARERFALRGRRYRGSTSAFR